MLTIIFYIFLLASLVQILYWCFLFSKLAFYRTPSESEIDDIPVSVIICARNEAKNLQKNLDRILNQNYRSYEVVVVNDHSTDDTENILLNFHIKYPILRTLTVTDKPQGSGKKFALAKGIEAARHNVLLLTDADCIPDSSDWIRKMIQPLNEQVGIVLGYAPYTSAKGFLNKWIRYETVMTAIQYLSFALQGWAYMGVGRNLLYRKALYQKANGFRQHDHLLSGDDDLFINAVATTQNVSIVLDKASFVYSAPKKSWAEFYRQKARHLSTGKHYRFQHQALLGLYSLTHFLHYLGGLVLIFNFSTIFVVAIIYLVRISIVVFLCRLLLRQMYDTPLLKWIPLLDAALPMYYLIFSPVLLIGNTDRWK